MQLNVFDFLISRFNNPKGNLYQGRFVRADLKYVSDDPNYYKNLRNTGRQPGFIYDQKHGNEDYSDFTPSNH